MGRSRSHTQFAHLDRSFGDPNNDRASDGASGTACGNGIARRSFGGLHARPRTWSEPSNVPRRAPHPLHDRLALRTRGRFAH